MEHRERADSTSVRPRVRERKTDCLICVDLASSAYSFTRRPNAGATRAAQVPNWRRPLVRRRKIWVRVPDSGYDIYYSSAFGSCLLIYDSYCKLHTRSKKAYFAPEVYNILFQRNSIFWYKCESVDSSTSVRFVARAKRGWQSHECMIIFRMCIERYFSIQGA